MASAPDGAEDVFDQFLTDRGHSTDRVGWMEDGLKKQCPECFALHDGDASSCAVCGWAPQR